MRYRRYHGYLTYVAPNTIVGDRILERIRLNKEFEKILKTMELAQKNDKQTIERLENLIKIKDAMVDTTRRSF